jgi:hypothetical protein
MLHRSWHTTQQDGRSSTSHQVPIHPRAPDGMCMVGGPAVQKYVLYTTLSQSQVQCLLCAVMLLTITFSCAQTFKLLWLCCH